MYCTRRETAVISKERQGIFFLEEGTERERKKKRDGPDGGWMVVRMHRCRLDEAFRHEPAQRCTVPRVEPTVPKKG